MKVGERVLDATGPAAPPRRNGELVFDAPWQSRVFGLTMVLYEAGLFAWEEHQTRLIAAIAAHEQDGGEWSYWACWLAALERLLADKGLCTARELDARLDELGARPAGHDH